MHSLWSFKLALEALVARFELLGTQSTLDLEALWTLKELDGHTPLHTFILVYSVRPMFLT